MNEQDPVTVDVDVTVTDHREPIFFLWTRSFWGGIFPALLTGIDVMFGLFASADTATPVTAALSLGINLIGMGFVEVTREEVHNTMMALAPIYAMIVGYQRSHAARPYTIDPRAIK